MELMTSVKSCLMLAEMDIGNWVYVLFAVIYVIVQLFSNKNKGESEEDTGEAQAAAEERRRQIQAEIQRRIRESMGQRKEEIPPPRPIERAEEPERVNPPVLTQRNTQPTKTSGRRIEPASGGMEAIEAQLRTQAERLKTAKRARDNALEKAEKVTLRARGGKEAMQLYSDRRVGDVRASVVGFLKDGKSLKAAIVLNEVMGTPMGLHEEIGPKR